MIAVLFARQDSIYKTVPGCDVFDIDRDARSWSGGCPVIAHPPCRAWGALRFLAKPRPDEKDLAYFAVDMVRAWGGVLEHPAGSTLWPAAALPAPTLRDRWGGWTFPISQKWWGHRAEKKTFLYIVGIEPHELPPYPFEMGEASHVIGDSGRASNGTKRPEVSKAEREHTPPLLAHWLVELAGKCKPPSRPAAGNHLEHCHANTSFRQGHQPRPPAP